MEATVWKQINVKSARSQFYSIASPFVQNSWCLRRNVLDIVGLMSEDGKFAAQQSRWHVVTMPRHCATNEKEASSFGGQSKQPSASGEDSVESAMILMLWTSHNRTSDVPPHFNIDFVCPLKANSTLVLAQNLNKFTGLFIRSLTTKCECWKQVLMWHIVHWWCAGAASE